MKCTRLDPPEYINSVLLKMLPEQQTVGRSKRSNRYGTSSIVNCNQFSPPVDVFSVILRHIYKYALRQTHIVLIEKVNGSGKEAYANEKQQSNDSFLLIVLYPKYHRASPILPFLYGFTVERQLLSLFAVLQVLRYWSQCSVRYVLLDKFRYCHHSLCRAVAGFIAITLQLLNTAGR